MKQAFMKFEKGGLRLLNDKEKKKFSKTVELSTDSEEVVENSLYVSFRSDHDKKRVLISLWADDFSIAYEHKELMKLLETIKDENKIKALIAAEGI